MSEDLIKRSDAIKAIINKPAWHGSDGSYYHGDDIRDALKSLPSADRLQGYWAKKNTCEFRCSNCGKIIFADCESERNYCPNCGSKNRINMLLKWDDMPLKGADNE